MPKSTRRLTILSVALLAAIVAAIALRPAGSLSENPAGSRKDEATQAIARLSQALAAPEETPTQALNPFRPPGDPVVSEPPESPRRSGVEMIGWAKLAGVEYALVSTPAGERYVQAGDTVEGWRVTQVTSQQLSLELGEARETVQLKERFSVTPLR